MMVNPLVPPTASSAHERELGVQSLWFHIGLPIADLKLHENPTGGTCSGGRGIITEVFLQGRAAKIRCLLCQGEAREEV